MVPPHGGTVPEVQRRSWYNLPNNRETLGPDHLIILVVVVVVVVMAVVAVVVVGVELLELVTWTLDCLKLKNWIFERRQGA